MNHVVRITVSFSIHLVVKNPYFLIEEIMFKEVISFLQSIWQPIQSVLQFKIIRGEAVSIKLSGLLLGLIVLFTGWKIIRSFVKKIDRYCWKGMPVMKMPENGWGILRVWYS